VGTRVLYSLIDEHARELVHQAVFQAEHAVEVWPRHHRPVVTSEAAAVAAR
jgi:hypothetical protein